MKCLPLRNDIETIMQRQKEDKEKLKELTFALWEAENGKFMEGVPAKHWGYKRVLRALGYVI